MARGVTCTHKPLSFNVNILQTGALYLKIPNSKSRFSDKKQVIGNPLAGEVFERLEIANKTHGNTKHNVEKGCIEKKTFHRTIVYLNTKVSILSIDIIMLS